MTPDPLDELREAVRVAQVYGPLNERLGGAVRCAAALERVLALLDEWESDIYTSEPSPEEPSQFEYGHQDGRDYAFRDLRAALTGETP